MLVSLQAIVVLLSLLSNRVTSQQTPAITTSSDRVGARACNDLNLLYQACQTLTPGFVDLVFTRQASCLCYGKPNSISLTHDPTSPLGLLAQTNQRTGKKQAGSTPPPTNHPSTTPSSPPARPTSPPHHPPPTQSSHPPTPTPPPPLPALPSVTSPARLLPTPSARPTSSPWPNPPRRIS